MKKTTLIYLRFLFYFFLPLYASFLSICRLFGFRRQIESSAIILPPAGPGSLGDDAMIQASIGFLKKKDIKNFGLIIYRKVVNPPFESIKKDIDQIDMSIFLKSSQLHQILLSFCKLFWKISRYQRIYLLGADVIDGKYSDDRLFRRLTILSMASKIDIFTTIIGSSYNGKPSEISIELLKEISCKVRSCLRDKRSLERFRQNVSSSATLTADAAFLLDPIDDSHNVKNAAKWIDIQRQSGKKIIGINICSHVVQGYSDKSSDDFIDVFVNALQTAYDRHDSNLAFVFIPHDYRQIPGDYTEKALSDNDLCEATISKLSPQINPSCFKIAFPCPAAEVKGIVQHLDCVITGRMHLAIACLGQGIPVASVTYQNKFEGLYDHFNIQPLTIEPGQLFEENQSPLIDLITHLIHHRDSIRQQILCGLVTVKALSASNF